MHEGCLLLRRSNILLMLALVTALSLIHTIHVAAHAPTHRPATTLRSAATTAAEMLILAMIKAAHAWSVLKLLLFEFNVPNFSLHVLKGVFEVFFNFLGLS